MQLKPFFSFFELNVKSLPCDWAIIFYTKHSMEKDNHINHVCGKLKTIIGDAHKLVHCGVSMFANNKKEQFVLDTYTAYDRNIVIKPDQDNSTVVPKCLMYYDIIPYLLSYERVIPMDSDIDWSNFNFDLAMKIWSSFESQPLLAQPLVSAPDGKLDSLYFRFRESSWHNKKSQAATTPIVELMAPIIDAHFFRWFTKYIISELIDHHINQRCDWGLDNTWCYAAKDYARYVLRRKDYDNACIIITGSNIDLACLNIYLSFF
jgi:hypothetical protein